MIRTNSTVLARLAAANWVATEEDVTQLATVVTQGTEANGSYLKVVLAECQAKLGPVRARARPMTVEAMAQVVDNAHARFYPAVLAGVGPSDLGTAERARRATFARTAKSTIMAAVRAAVDIRTLPVDTVTKRQLRELAKAGTAPPGPEPSPEAVPIAKTVQRAERMLINALTALEAEDHAAAVLAMGRIVDALDKIVSFEEATEATTTGTIVGARLQQHQQPTYVMGGARP